MKRHVTLLAVMMTSLALAQTPPAATPTAQTQIENVLLTKGMLVIKEFYPDQTVPGLYGTKLVFSGARFYQPGKEAEAVKGVRVTVYEGSKSYESTIKFLDFDEIESLLKSIDFMQSLADSWKGTERPYTEVQYQSKSGFTFGFYRSAQEISLFGTASTNDVYMPISALAQVKTALQTAYNNIK